MTGLVWIVGVLAVGCASGGANSADSGSPDTGTEVDGAARDAMVDGSVGDSGSSDGGLEAPDGSAIDAGADGATSLLPETVEPCEPGRPMSCWLALMASGACGTSTLDENFGTDLYNVHTFSVPVRAGIAVEITLRRTGASFDPALVLHDASGATIYNGQRGVVDATLNVEALSTGRGSDVASVRVTSTIDTEVLGFLTGWHVIDGAFVPRMPMGATYTLGVLTDCEPPTGLTSPPNFDPSDMVSGYYTLPDSEPPGLYTRKARCAFGNRLLIDVLYTVALRWAALRPGDAPIAISDLNECNPRLPGDADHATHDDGTHADLSAGCATRVGCDLNASIDLAKLFVDTGQVCGIIFDDSDVQAVVNSYFRAAYAYTPWHGGSARTFMRTVGGHTAHFHVRVMRPDGTCVPLT